MATKIDAHALLTSQGWRGKGHSLHPTNDDTGLKHHILIRREGSDGRGIGAKKDHKQEAWWMNAFDQALKGIDTSSGSMKRTAGSGKLDIEKITAKGAKKYTGASGLYTSFVRGGLLKGTVEMGAGGLPTPPDSGAGTPTAELREERKETKEERRARRGTKQLKKAEDAAKEAAKQKAALKAQKKAQKKADKAALKAGETKEQRRARRDARRARKEEKRRRKRSEG
ncbi:hypothetical protein JX265_001570 [Neoarthrinium moseri]|uniref:Uncharacterized protein n=1 Tax=Neoarthrinium moseri TaxID=1658444 RepID=A0A9Q0ATF4_9PEZI|nr:hypothetical protein JX265_001570 [Neoarthrinium moseri]